MSSGLLIADMVRYVFLLLCLTLGLSSSWAAEADGAFRILHVDLPATIEPGQRVIGSVELEVLEPDTPPFTRPFASFRSLEEGGPAFTLPAGAHTPWKLPAAQKRGDRFNIAFTMDIPLDAPAGPAEFGFQVARHPEGKGWQYAELETAEGQPTGQKATWKTQVNAKAPNAASADMPLVVQTMAKPVVDGVIDTNEWAGAGRVGVFSENLHGKAPKAATQGYIGYDDTTLYIALQCTEPLPDAIAAHEYGDRQDPPIWNNECVEIFMNPQADRASYLHFLVDILNQRHDALGSDFYGYNPPWESAVQRDTAGWTVEIAIPFASLGVETPEEGALWYGNLCRERKAELELSAWQATHGAFSAPGRFGDWVFGSLKARLADAAKALDTEKDQWPGEMEAAAKQWEERRSAWTTEFASLDEAAVRGSYGELHRALEGLENGLEALRLKAARLSGKTFVIARAWPYERFLGEPSSQDRPVGPESITLLDGEWMDLAWNLTNLSDMPVTLRCTTRHSETDDRAGFLYLAIPGVETVWQEGIPVAAADGTAVHDALAPRPAGIVSVAPGQTRQVWLSLRNSGDWADTKKARILFQPVDGSPGEPVTVPLTVDRIAAEIAAARSIHCFTWNLIWPDVAQTRPAWFRAHVEDLASHGVDVCMVHRLQTIGGVKANSDGTLAEQPDFAKTDALLDATMDVFAMYYVTIDIGEKGKHRKDLFGIKFGTPEYEKAFKTWFGLVVKHLLAKGLTYERFAVNPYDESVGEDCRTLSRWIKEVDPKVQVIIDCSTPDLDIARKMDALTDIWVPHYKTFFPEDMKPFHELVVATGKPRWCYYYSEGGNDKLQDPTRHYLAKFWWAFANDVAGIGYWAQQYYGDPWYRAAYKNAYDTTLVYPTESGPIPSRRWQAWRRGWQDHCLLSLAQKVCKDRGDTEAAAKVKALAADIASVPGDPERAASARGWLKRMIIQGDKTAR